MADAIDDVSWLIEPPGPKEVVFRLEVGHEVELSDEARHAIDVLVNEFYGDEVSGFVFNAGFIGGCWIDVGKCDPYSKCTKARCAPVITSPCAVNQSCRIGQ